MSEITRDRLVAAVGFDPLKDRQRRDDYDAGYRRAIEDSAERLELLLRQTWKRTAEDHAFRSGVFRCLDLVRSRLDLTQPARVESECTCWRLSNDMPCPVHRIDAIECRECLGTPTRPNGPCDDPIHGSAAKPTVCARCGGRGYHRYVTNMDGQRHQAPCPSCKGGA